MLLQRVVETLGLQTQVPYSLWLNVDLILDTRSGVAWYRRTELTDLKAHSHPFKFAVEVARAQGNLVSKQQLNEVLSEARRDDEAAKAAKRDFIRLLQSSLKKAGVVCPSDTTKIFRSSPGGYALSATATVL